MGTLKVKFDNSNKWTKIPTVKGEKGDPRKRWSCFSRTS